MTFYKIEKISQNEEHLGEGDCVAMHFYFDGREICTVLLAPTKDGYYETHVSDLPHDLLNKGFGVEIYSQVFSYCLNNKIQLASSESRCEEVERLWKSKRLNENFNISKYKGRYFLLDL